MTFSLLSILGSAANVTSGLLKGGQDVNNALPQDQQAQLFENIIQGQAAQPLSAFEMWQQTQQPFQPKILLQGQGAHLLSPAVAGEGEGEGLDVAALLPAGEEALDFLNGLLEQVGQNLPEAATLPQWFRDRLTQTEGEMQPLTPEELSELTAETGIPVAVLLVVVEQTPLANPALALNLTQQDVADAAEFMKAALVNPRALAEGKTPQAEAEAPAIQPDAAKALADDAQAADELLARFEKLLAKISAQPQEEGEEKSAYAQLAQLIGDAKAQRKPQPQGNEQYRATAQQTLEKAASPEVIAPRVQGDVDAADMVADEGGEVKTVPSQQQASPSTRMEGAGSPVQGVAAQEARAEQVAKTEAPAQPRYIPRSVEAPLQEVTIHLAKAVRDGVQRLEVQLRPEALGRVDFVIETDKDGVSRVQVIAEKRETLELFQRDVRNLERVLQDAGIKTEQNQLSFNLRGGDSQQGRGNGAEQQEKQDGQFAKVLQGDEAVDDRRELSEMALGYDAGKGYRLNLDLGLDISV